MSFDLGLTNRRALVTGGTKGVGSAVVEALRVAGAQVVATARSSPDQPAEGVRYVAADLSTAEGASSVAHAMLKQLGGIEPGVASSGQLPISTLTGLPQAGFGVT
jgi:NAD(P)-dependent dehydrogenase (short-subunit alcohol dehydrogenase family)